MRRALVRVTPAANARQIHLELEAEPALPSCRTDSSRLEQILVNLLGNAVQHSPEGAMVLVRITHRDALIQYAVEDQGPGVEPDDLERIFDIYVTKAAGEHRGMGLGLPLSRRLARLLGGELRAELRSEGGGRFVLELPASPPES